MRERDRPDSLTVDLKTSIVAVLVDWPPAATSMLDSQPMIHPVS